jgi:hypothetical protein
MATSDIDIASQALVLIGANPISDFDEGSTEATVADNVYEMIVASALTRYRWRFATGQIALSRLASGPVARWDAAYQKPTDPMLLAIHAVTVLDNPIQFDIYEDKIYCDAATDDIVVMDYTYRSGTADWPPYFIRALVYDLAGVFAGSIAQKGELADHYENRAEFYYQKASNVEAQQRTTKRINARKSLINTRFS